MLFRKPLTKDLDLESEEEKEASDILQSLAQFKLNTTPTINRNAFKPL